MASLGGLVAGLLHEINSPLGAARAANDTTARCVVKMEEKAGDAFRTVIDIVRGNTAVIGAAADRIAALVASLKNFARPDETEYQLVSLHEGIESTLTVMGGELQERIVLVKEYGEIPKVTCYAGQLNQVFMGILRNAVEAIEGEGTIRIRTFEAKDGVHVQISDTGRGIGPEKLKRIFEFDFSGKGSRVKMGAGLATAYGGLIEVKSEVGSGSTFEVILPSRLEKRVTGGEGTSRR
jgi:signal transduction histidine kinase